MRTTQGVSTQVLPARDGCGDVSMRNGSSPAGHRARGGPGKCWWTVLCYALLLFVSNIHSAQAGVQYLYDEANRLVQVVDAAGDAAHYQYDPAGNIVAIRRYAAADLAITEFIPESGPVGTTVTIYGVGFSATPGSNLVSFYGAATTVSAASSINLVTQVPVGATTGPISVTVGSATATSSKPFTVTTDPLHAPPVITSFSPTVGPVGTTVTINGEHFEPSVASEFVKFNITRVVPTSSAANQIVSDVPTGATSGHIYVRTPYGAATSSSDFFVPPSGYTPSQVGATARIVVDSAALPINTGTAGKIAMVLFEGVQGQSLGLGISPVTFSPSGGSASLRIYSPLGTQIFSSSFSAGTSFDLPVLPQSGTYTIAIIPSPTATLDATLTLSSDLTAALAPGAVQTFSTTRVGQNARYSFAGTQGQNQSLLFSADVIPGFTYIYVYKPDGTQLASSSVYYGSGAGSTGALNLNNLLATGTYSLFITPSGVATGAMNVSLQGQASEPVSIDGGATAVTLAAGQNLRYSFTGTAGQGLGLGVTNVSTTPSGGTVLVTVYKPDGTSLKTCGSYSATGGDCDLPLLPVSGTYTVFANPGNNAASLNLLLSADLTATLAPGAVQTFSTTRVGQNARYSFAGTQGQNQSLLFSADVIPGITYIYVYKPDGTQLASSLVYYSSGAGSTGTLNLNNLLATGTYSLFITPSGVTTGAMNVSLQGQASEPVSIDGGATTVTLAAGQNLRYSFTGTAGQGLGLGVTNVSTTPSGGTVLVTVYKPDGTSLMTCGSFTTGGSCDLPALPANGTYTIFANAGNNAASLNLLLSEDLTGTLNPGAVQTFSTTRAGQNARYNFSGTAGQNQSLLISADVFPSYTYVYVYRPDGTQLAYTYLNYTSGAGSTGTLDLNNLPVTGTYTVFVTPSGVSTGSMRLSLQGQGSAVGIDGGATAVNLASGQNLRYTFTGSTGQRLGLGVTDVTTTPSGGTVVVTVYKPDGTSLMTCGSFTTGGSCDVPLLPVSGTYTVFANPGNNAASLNLWLSADVTATVTPGAVQTFSTTRVGQNARYSFDGTQGQNQSLLFSADVFPGYTNVWVYKPDGTQLAYTYVYYSSGAGTGTTLNLTNLPATGNYKVFITPSGVATGSMNVQIP